MNTAIASPLLAVVPIEAIGVLAGVLALGLVTIVLVLRNVLYVCQPSEVLIFSGRSRKAKGEHIGYRVIRGGRALRVPLIETVDRMDLSNMIIEVRVEGAYSRGGIPLNVSGIANIKVPGEEPLLNNTLERFLGCSRSEIMKAARETLEGNLRGVMATLTPEQVNRDKEAFASRLTEEAEADLSKLGLVLDTLNIQNISDDVGYLDAIGRQRSAQIRKTAQIAEAGTQAEAARQKWENNKNSELAKIRAQKEILHKEIAQKIADARSRRAALIATEQAEVQAEVAQSRAEIEMQDARIEQVRRRLRADVIQPAEAACQAAQERAKGEAAKITEQGTATANALIQISESYRKSGAHGRDLMLMNKLVPLLDTLSGTIGALEVNRLTVLPTGPRGQGDSAAPLGARLIELGEQIRAATGVDLAQALKDRLEPAEARRGVPPTPRPSKRVS